MRMFTLLIATGAVSVDTRARAVRNAKVWAAMTGRPVPVHSYVETAPGNYHETYLGRAILSRVTNKAVWVRARGVPTA